MSRSQRISFTYKANSMSIRVEATVRPSIPGRAASLSHHGEPDWGPEIDVTGCWIDSADETQSVPFDYEGFCLCRGSNCTPLIDDIENEAWEYFQLSH